MEKGKERQLSETYYNHSIMSASVNHNGKQLNDGCNNGYVEIILKNEGCSNMNCEILDDNSFKLKFIGNSERENLLKALKMIVKELEENE